MIINPGEGTGEHHMARFLGRVRHVGDARFEHRGDERGEGSESGEWHVFGKDRYKWHVDDEGSLHVRTHDVSEESEAALGFRSTEGLGAPEAERSEERDRRPWRRAHDGSLLPPPVSNDGGQAVGLGAFYDQFYARRS
jgi:hypothetical protein